MSLLQEALNACAALTRRVEHLEYDKVAQALEITNLKRRVKKLEKGNRVKGWMKDDLDKDDVVALKDDKEEEKKEKEVKDDQVQGRQAKIYKIDLDHASKVLSMQDDEPVEVQEVVDVVTTAKLITDVFTVASKTVTAASTTISASEPQVPDAAITTDALKKQQVKMDEEYVRKLHEDLNKYIDPDVAINHVKQKAKEDLAVQRYQGMSYDDIHPIFEAKFNSNIEFLLKTKEQLVEKENRAIQSINETPAQKAAKRKKLNEEVEDHKRHLEIVPDEDDDVYIEATPLARKPNNFSDDFLLTTLGPMFERPDGQAQVWKNLRTVHGQAKVKSWKLLESCEDTVMEDASNQGWMIDYLDKDDVVALKDDKEEEKKEKEVKDDQVQGRQAEIYKIDLDHASKVLSMQDDEPAEVQEVVDVVTTAKLITDVFTAASKTVTAASTTIFAAEPQVPDAAITTAALVRTKELKPLKKKQQVEMDEEYVRKLHEDLNKDIDLDVAINHVKQKAKEDPAVQRYQGISYDDIHPIFEAKFNSNIEFLLKTKEQLVEKENRAIQSINETPAQKAAKRKKLNEEVTDLKRHFGDCA
nr:hypothetical protein [Tanacetum cinerariifolium]